MGLKIATISNSFENGFMNFSQKQFVLEIESSKYFIMCSFKGIYIVR